MTRRDTLKLGVTAAFAKTMPTNPANDICYMRAVDILAAIRAKKLSAREVMQAHLKQIGRVNPHVNAIVTLVPEDVLLARARAADDALAKGESLGPLSIFIIVATGPT